MTVRLLTIGHSYVVANNRRLAHAMALAGGGAWEVTAVAPERYPGDLRPLACEPMPDEASRLATVPVRFARRPHVMRWGGALRSILREGWDVVHVWEEPFVLGGAQLAAWAPRGARLVFATFQNLPKRYPPPFSWAERRAMRRADGWIAFGRTVEAALRDRRGYRDRPHAVLPPGVDTGLFRPDAAARARVRTTLGWAGDGPPVVGFLGRFVPEKGWATLTAALDAARGPWRALFVGGGPDEAALRAWAARHGEGRARVVTGVRHGEVPAWLNAMDLLAAPSRTTPRWKEQLGRMLVEAMACGVPVAGSDSGEIPHVIGGAGAVLPEGDAGAWAEALSHLLADPARRDGMAGAGRARVAADFALDVVAARHLAFFRTLA